MIILTSNNLSIEYNTFASSGHGRLFGTSSSAIEYNNFTSSVFYLTKGIAPTGSNNNYIEYNNFSSVAIGPVCT